MIAIRSPANIASYSPSLLEAEKSKVKDCSIMDPSGVVRTIPMPALLLFKALSTFRTHPSNKSHCSVALGVKLAMKSAKTCPLIDVFGSYLRP